MTVIHIVIFGVKNFTRFDADHQVIYLSTYHLSKTESRTKNTFSRTYLTSNTAFEVKCLL